MTLRDLVSALRMYPEDLPVRYEHGGIPIAFDSWRGRYDELTLTFENPGENEPTTTVRDLLHLAEQAATGQVFTGYKGGEYQMTWSTPVWADAYGTAHYDIPVALSVTDTDMVVIQTSNIQEYV